jgi:hypothetical protein
MVNGEGEKQHISSSLKKFVKEKKMEAQASRGIERRKDL